MKVIKDLYTIKGWQPNNKEQLVNGLNNLISHIDGEPMAEVIPFDTKNYDIEEVDLLDVLNDGVEIDIQQYTRIIFNNIEIHQQFLILNKMRSDENKSLLLKSEFMKNYSKINTEISCRLEREFLHARNKTEDYFKDDESFVDYNNWINSFEKFNDELELALYCFVW